MKIHEFFKDQFSYAAGVEEWCKKYYDFITDSNGELTYTFCNDFAIADWYGLKDVNETYNRVKKYWIDDYKAFTEVVISLNLLAWANDQLIKQGFENREGIMNNYSELYYKARDDYYKHYKGQQDKLDYIFDMTD